MTEIAPDFAKPRRRWRITPTTLFIVVGVNLAVTFAVHMVYLQAPIDSISNWGIMRWAAAMLLYVGVFTLGAIVVRRSDRSVHVMFWGIVAVTLCDVFSAAVYMTMTNTAGWGFYFFIWAIYVMALYFAAAKALALKGFAWVRAMPMAVLSIGLTALSSWYLPFEYIVYPQETEEIASEPEYDIDTEELYARQDGLLQAQLGALKPQDSGKVELFALLGAGDATQSVFLSEVNAVAQILEDGFDAKGKILRLANSERQPYEYPIAGRYNMARALKALGAHVGPEDVALIYLTSHGAPDVFALNFYDAGLPDLTAEEFAQMLDASGIQHAVVVLQACYSGSFIDDIAADNRLIITAANQDRTSFGCADGRDWTEFGKAYFDVSLRKSKDFRVAFAQAEPLIAAREQDVGVLPSQPQIKEGIKIGATLDVLSQQLRANITQP